jgi:hypothetical protein
MSRFLKLEIISARFGLLLKIIEAMMHKTPFFCMVLFISFASLAHAEFNLTVSTVEGEGTLHFGTLDSLEVDGAPTSISETRQVRLTIDTDLGQRYTIFQEVQGEAVNGEGDPCALNAFHFFAVAQAGSGIVRVPNRIPLQFGEQELYLSDEVGGPTELLVQYDFLVPSSQEAGHYQTIITYRAVAS